MRISDWSSDVCSSDLLCADQLVLALADRGQIAGLTKNATDPEMSGEAVKARGIALLSNSAEQILAIEPDLIVGMPASRGAALAALPKQNYRSEEHTSELQSLMRISYAVFCLKKKKNTYRS